MTPRATASTDRPRSFGVCSHRVRDVSKHVPAPALQVIEREARQGRTRRDSEALETAILSRLRMFDEKYSASLPDAGDGADSGFSRPHGRKSALTPWQRQPVQSGPPSVQNTPHKSVRGAWRYSGDGCGPSRLCQGTGG